jgi:hypothetical protein
LSYQEQLWQTLEGQEKGAQQAKNAAKKSKKVLSDMPLQIY